MSRKYHSMQFNAFLNAIKTALSIAFPLITYPYAFRVLHAENIGKVNFAASIESYFALIAALGFSTYAIREGSKVRENQKKFNEFASDIFSLNVCSVIISFTLEFLVLFIIPYLHDYRLLIIIQSTAIIFTTIGMDWINSVYEDFVYITIRTIIANIISMICLFVFVHKPEDYYIYAFLTALTQAIICISNVAYYRKRTKITFGLPSRVLVHIKPVLTLFMNNIALSIYVNSDTTMLGWFSGDYYVGIYALSVKVYTVIKNMISAIYSVTIPRISIYLSENNDEKVRNIYSGICSEIIVILLPASAGLLSISDEIVLLMGGQEYLESSLTLKILSISLVGAILGGLATFCMNIPLGKEKINVEATSLSALINILLNFLMIPVLMHNGAAITTAISEFFVFFYCIIRNKKILEYIDRKIIKKSLFSAGIGVVTVFLVSFITHQIFSYNMLSMLVIIALSVLFYFAELIFLKNELVLSIVNKIRVKK